MKHRKADIRASDTCCGLELSPIVNHTPNSDSTILKTSRYMTTIVLVWQMQISTGTEQSPGSWICIQQLQMLACDAKNRSGLQILLQISIQVSVVHLDPCYTLHSVLNLKVGLNLRA